MKVLAIMGSPRKHDGYRIIRKIEEEMSRLGSIEFEYLFLKDFDIGDCTGCGACFSRGEQFCPRKDGFAHVIDSMDRADGLIFSSPVYAHQVSSSIKRLADRGSYLFHRPRFSEKTAIVLATTAMDGLRETLAYLKLVVVGWGFGFVGSLGIVSLRYFPEGSRYDARYARAVEERIRKISARFRHFVAERKRPAPDPFALAMFSAMRRKSLHFAADRDYWTARGWYDRPYFNTDSIGPFRRLMLFCLRLLLPLYVG